MPEPSQPRVHRSLVRTVAEVAAVWTIASGAYGILLPGSATLIPYHQYPLLTIFYYTFWIAVSVYWFQDVIDSWVPDGGRLRSYLLVIFLSVFLGWFYCILLPLLPAADTGPIVDLNVYLAPGDPSYLLSKIFEIMLQQVLVLILVLALWNQYHSLVKVSLIYAELFLIAHLFLLVQGYAVPYVALYSGAAIVSALMFPALILRVPSGFVYAYMLHWAFYVWLAVFVRM